MQFFDMLNKAILVVTSITMILSIINLVIQHRKSKKLDENIAIELQYGEDKKLIPLKIKRRHFTRSEIQGNLANSYKEQSYNIPYLGTTDYADGIVDVQDGKSDKLVIKIEDKEIYDNFAC